MASSALLALAFGTGPAVSLDNMFPNYGWSCWDGTLANGGFCQTDNRDMTVWTQSATPSSVKSVIRKTILAQYNPTDLNVTFASSAVYSGGSETDLINQSGPLPYDVVGTAFCDDASSSTKCDQHYVRYNHNVREQGPINGSDVCHETGHSVGLSHGRDANPRVGQNDSRVGCLAVNDVYSLGSNNRTNINRTY